MNRVNHLLPVLGIGHAVPSVCGAQHLHIRLSAFHQTVHYIRKIKLHLSQIPARRIQKLPELILKALQGTGRKSPAVHRNGTVLGKRFPGCAVILGEHRTAVPQFNMRALYQPGQIALRIDRTHTAGNIAVFGQRIFQLITCHCDMHLSRRGRVRKSYSSR